jgi:hypothetical protein
LFIFNLSFKLFSIRSFLIETIRPVDHKVELIKLMSMNGASVD